MNSTIKDNYEQVINRITNSARLAGRNPEEIRLVVVTKTQSIENIKSVIDAGATDLGENYVEDAIPKMHVFDGNQSIRWHMIGHVQGRKAVLVCENFQFLHSLDSLKLAERLSGYLFRINRILPVYLEFNVSGEEFKSGWNICREDLWDDVIQEIEKIYALPNLEFLGVMAIPPYSPDPEASRLYFRNLRKFQEYIIRFLKLENIIELSIGMSGDFEVAIQEGSTCVRIGQAIFGPRVG